MGPKLDRYPAARAGRGGQAPAEPVDRVKYRCRVEVPSTQELLILRIPKPNEFIGFGAMDVTKPYEFIGFRAMDVTKPYEFIGFGAMDLRAT